MMNNRGRLTTQQLRILAVAWVGVVIMVAACTFLAIFFGSQARRPGRAVAQATSDTPFVLPTPTAGPATDVPPPDVTAAPTIPPRLDPSFGYGIQIQAHINTEQTLDQVQQLGMGWIKQQIAWKDLEPQRGQANWDALDSIFRATSERGLKAMVSLTDAPDWARSVNATDLAGPPDDPQDFANYVSQLLQRYPGAIHAIELWNEPNLRDRGWYTAGGLSAASYVQLLAPASEAIRQIDPNVIVISAALAPTGETSARAIDDFVYMQAMIDAGMLDHVDCVGAHSNGINLPPQYAYDAGFNDPTARYRGPFDNPHHSWSFYSTITGYHDLVVAAGRDTKICVTEFGWPTAEGLEGSAPAEFGFAYDVSEEEQGEYIVRAYQLMHEWDFVWLAFLFNLDIASKAERSDPVKDPVLWSITDQNGAPRPAFDALRDMPKPP